MQHKISPFFLKKFLPGKQLLPKFIYTFALLWFMWFGLFYLLPNSYYGMRKIWDQLLSLCFFLGLSYACFAYFMFAVGHCIYVFFKRAYLIPGIACLNQLLGLIVLTWLGQCLSLLGFQLAFDYYFQDHAPSPTHVLFSNWYLGLIPLLFR